MQQTQGTRRGAPPRVRIVRFEPAGQLEDESEGYLFAFAAASPTDFAEALHAVRSLPPWQRIWLPMAQVWWVHEDSLSMLARRIPDLWARIKQEVAERPTRLCTPRSVQWAWQLAPRHVRDAFTALSLRCDASPEEVKTAYRVHAKRVHPDKGGSHSAMLALNIAYACALDWSIQTTPAREARREAASTVY